MRITILHSEVVANASLDDQETLEQVAAVHQALALKGHQVSELAFSLDFSKLIPKLREQKSDIVFNLVEAVNGSADLVHFAPLLLEQLQIPFTGANAANIHLSANKLVAKHWLTVGELATPRWSTEAHCAQFDSFPAIVKSISEHGSFGMDENAIVNDRNELANILQDRQLRFGGAWFAEEYIPGREFNIAVIAEDKNFKVLPIAEMQFINKHRHKYDIIDYAMKWQCEHPTYDDVERVFVSAQEQSLNTYLTDLAVKCARWFNLSSYGRIDVRLDAQQQAWILELNFNPSLAPDAGFAKQAAKMGLDYASMIEKIVAIAL